MVMTADSHHHPADALGAQAKARPNDKALIFPEEPATLTFGRWHADAGTLARSLIDLGVRPGDPVALVAENRTSWAVVQMAAAACGALFVPLNTHYRRDDLIEALQLSRAKVLFAVPEFRGNPYLVNVEAAREVLPDLEHVIGIAEGSGYADLVAAGDASGAVLPARDPDAPAALLFTSGTTGAPKGAVLTHRAMMMNAREAARRLGIGAADRWTSIIPLFHCAGCIMNMLGCLQTGAAYVGVPAFDPVLMFDVIERERCTALSGVPTSYLAMLDHPRRGEFDLSSLRTGTCGGADCNTEVLERCAREFPIPRVCQVYGQTESATLVSAAAADDPKRFATAGRPLRGYEVRIVDPKSGADQAPGGIGEIWARGPMVMLGYHDQPEATAETITEDGWLKTGDLGTVTDSGHLVVGGGRLRDMIIRGGENIYPAEIENLLQSHPAIEKVAVFGLPDDYYGERVAAAVVLAADTSAEELRDFCRDRIAGFKVPVEFYRMDAFPQTPSGKIRKTEIREQVERGASSPLA